jgi:hypothetical protein
VVFFDVGHSKTTIFAALVNKDSAKIVLELSDRNLGVRNID